MAPQNGAVTHLRRALPEIGGWAAALAIAVIVVGQVASTARSEVLFRDADSLVVALVTRSLVEGSATQWAMSPVLFLPEVAAFLPLWLVAHSLLGMELFGVLAVSAVINVALLYGALRFAAGRRGESRAPVVTALVALGLFGLLAASEFSASRDSLELASLSLTSTYYVGTVAAMLITLGALRRHRDQPRNGTALLITLALVAFVSTLSNPLFIAWATAPLALLLGWRMILGDVPARRELVLLVGGSALGYLGRIPLSAWIADTSATYAQPARWLDAASTYLTLLGERLSTPQGLLAALLVVGLLGLGVERTRHARGSGTTLVAMASWLIPAVVIVGMIAMGTQSARYLQPVVWAPLLAVLCVPRTPLPRRLRTVLAVTLSIVLLLTAVLSTQRIRAAVQHPDPELACVTDWIGAHPEQTGAGQFWTVRLPKALLPDPSQLVQVDHELNAYAWLVDRGDFSVDAVTFLIEDTQTVAWNFPRRDNATEISCGRYTIVQLPEPVPLGPQRS